MKLLITKGSHIFVACPARVSTGGPELLHQLVFRLRELGHQAFMFYMPSDHSDPVHPQLAEYGNPYVQTVEDAGANILLVPETFPEILENYRHVQKVLWWLSVDLHYDVMFKKTLWGRIGTRLNKWFHHMIDLEGARAVYAHEAELPQVYCGYLHFVQSEYARQHLLAKGIESLEYLSDYLNDAFISRACSSVKENVVLFNPNKGYKFTQKIIALAPDIQWLPIRKMTRDEVAQRLGSAKVYIDFGCHPGKDRIPREAAISGCCVITGKEGSAFYLEDVSIPDDYKFQNSTDQLFAIVAIVRDCLHRYDYHSKRFEEYRARIRAEKKLFEDDVERIFSTME